ncbi:MAG: thioredoxin-like domain-containing protein [Lentisphaeria bacterium]
MLRYTQLVLIVTLLTSIIACSSDTRESTTETTKPATAATAGSGAAKLFPDGLVDSENQPVDIDYLDGKLVALYFSAKWCGPCRRFTPLLIKYHSENKDDFEVVFVSSDRKVEQQQEYMKKASMPWPAVPFNSPAANKLKELNTKRSIPTLIIMDKNGEQITSTGRNLVTNNVDVDRIKTGTMEKENYTCDKCTKIHVRKKFKLGRKK